MVTTANKGASKTGLLISPSDDGYVVRGDIDALAPGLKAFAAWDEKLGAWTVSRKRAYEYDHQYGLRLFGSGAGKKA